MSGWQWQWHWQYGNVVSAQVGLVLCLPVTLEQLHGFKKYSTNISRVAEIFNTMSAQSSIMIFGII